MPLDGKGYKIAAWIGVGLIALGALVLALRGEWSGAALLAVFLAASIAFLAFEDRLPALFDLLFVAAALINGAGWVWDLYTKVWGYDEVAHFYTTFAATLALGYLLLYAVRPHFAERRLLFFMTISSFGVTLGAWWEVLESMMLKKLIDPVNDIVVDSLGALLAGLLAVWALTRETPADVGSGSRR